MSDGPIKMAPPGPSDGPALDDIILGDDDQTVPAHVPQYSAAPPRASASPPRASAAPPEGGHTTKDVASEDRASRAPRERSSNRVRAAEPARDASTTKKRSKMTLRIPDDEVSRPQLPAATPMGGVPAIAASRPPSSPALDDDPTAMPVKPQRIISVGPPPPGPADETLELPAADLEARGSTVSHAAGIDPGQEAGWTPYQPMVADRIPADVGGDRIMARGRDAAAAAAAQAAMREPARTMIDDPSINIFAQHREERTSDAPASEDIPIDTDDVDDSSSDARFDEVQTSPRLPASHDSEEIKIEEVERHTDPGEVPDEVDPDDLVSVESIAQSPHAPPLLRGTGKHVAYTPPPVTATSLMSGSAQVAGSPLGAPLPLAASAGGSHSSGSVTPIAPAVAARSPSGRPSASASGDAVPDYVPAAARGAALPKSGQGRPLSLDLSSGSSTDPGDPGPAAGTPMARRQQPAGGPFGVVPQVGALAPPPMSDHAANRKKTRPWWEDLFNDDFIRTMAKITDGDIAREANFIEESLGCEAGATILDLACGTGRHAVELASRGYQVVGFDLSLAMLARASDEAQDRKQKINFVQGDMREMTFEETFDGVFSWNTSFGFFDEEKNAAVIAKVHRALKKGGQFLLDVVNRDSLIRSAPSLAWFEGDGCICMDEMQIDFITSRMKVKRTLMMDDGRTKEIEYSIRVYSLHELGKMLHDNGFRVAEVSGRTGTPGVFFGCESPRTLILAEKR